MAEKGFVWVKDKAGNEFVCKVEDLKDIFRREKTGFYPIATLGEYSF
jgi:hypothetical protein